VCDERDPKGVWMKKKTILVVDDDQMVLSIISEYLTEFGYEVLSASDVKTGLGVFRSRGKDIDLAMIDIKIGRESGFTFADTLEDEFRFYHYAFLTAFFWEEKTLEELLRRGKPYFEKPLKFEKEVLPFLEDYFK
jgi:two-component system response regulator VanR